MIPIYYFYVIYDKYYDLNMIEGYINLDLELPNEISS